MATFQATFMTIRDDARPTVSGVSAPMPVADLSTAQRLTDLTTSGTSQVVQRSAADWTSPGNGVLRVFCSGAVNIAAGSAPTASATVGLPLPAGIVDYVTVTKGQKLAVIDA